MADFNRMARDAGWRCIDEELPYLAGLFTYPWRPVDTKANLHEFQRTAEDVCRVEGIQTD